VRTLFGLLKKKLSSFSDKLKKKVEEKPETKQEAEIQKPEKISAEEEILKEAEAEVLAEEKQARQKPEKKEIKEEKKPVPEKEKPAIPEEPEPEILEEQQEEIIQEEKEPFPAEQKEEKIEIPKIEEEKRELKTRLGLGKKVKRFFRAEVTIQEKDLEELIEELELSLLEADVEQETAQKIAEEMKKRLAGKKIGSGKNIDSEIKNEIKEILLEIMKTETIDLMGEIKKHSPYKILFLGPNGAGKTTSIAKLTKRLQDSGLKVIWAAGDTFRAASIEQLETHAKRLGIRVVKHKYGADPAAVGFDAVKAAEAKKIDVVLIDSAGRQETNKNLMEELKKIVRVVKPDLKIYVGESFTGQALLQQASEYNEKIGIDAFILSKIDCDAKGGTTISLLHSLKKPVLFVGTGQEYKDLEEFKPEFVLDRIL